MKNLEEMIADGDITLTDDEAELATADVGVAMRHTPEAHANIPDMWKDQIDYGECSECAHPIFFRKNFPKGMRKVCHVCAMDIVPTDENPVLMTRKTALEEIRAYHKKKGN